ncbi:type II toxin-antitoxin system RelE/ParE family toxin [Corticimicrobacter populi]|uniref:Addiction module toxin RelE n=1 Tax=Corticimicrobacter populi TaxID=2175229 RepID=A0A2V1JY69_9BURK|nr:type II toxin-antitoxin system RelE/ParE family toxin [Corticimicrobacter populi]PWF21454.1 addiction module toxin RelE [Corticimicrobacter populi]
MTAKWDVEYTDELAEWWAKLTELEQVSIDTSVRLLEEKGPNLGFPHTSSIAGSRHAHMRELRVQHAGRPYRILYAFDPRRCAILLLGGDKTGNDRWYEKNIPIADALYDIHIGTLGKERRINGKKIQ